MSFTNIELHAHTDASLADGAMSYKEYVNRAKELGASAIAITDHGGAWNWLDFYNYCRKQGVKPILGTEGYISKIIDLSSETTISKRMHILLLAKDYKGFQAISRYISESNRHIDSRGKPLGTIQMLYDFFGPDSKGYGHVICSSACIAGVLAIPFSTNLFIDKEIGKIKKRVATSESNLPDDYKEAKRIDDETNVRKDMISKRIAELNPISKKSFTKIKKTIKKMEDGPEKEMMAASLAAEMEITQKAKDEIADLKEQKKVITENAKPYHKIVMGCKDKLEKILANKDLIKLLEQSRRSEEELYNDAKQMALTLVDIFGKDNFFAEIQYHEIDMEKEIYPKIVSLAKDLGIKMVATNDVHMARREDLKKRELLRNFGDISQKDPKWSASIQGDSELYYKTGDEKAAMLLEILPEDVVNEAMTNIEVIADQCNLELSDEKHYPKFENAKGLLRQMCEEGIKEFYPGNLWTKELADRMEYELKTIDQMGFNDYFCEVADFIRYAKEHGDNSVEIGPGRGCAEKGTLVYTKDGVKPIENIKVNDDVYDCEGELKKVVETFKYDVDEDLCQIQLWNGGKINYTSDHKMLMVPCREETDYHKRDQGYRYLDNKPERTALWKPANQLKQGDWMVMPRPEMTTDEDETTIDLADYASKLTIVKESSIVIKNYKKLKENGVSIKEICNTTGLSKNAVSNVYNNGNSISKVLTVEKITNFLNEKGFSIDEWRDIPVNIEIPRFIRLDENFAYLAGYYIADGWCHGDEVNFAFNTETENDYFEKIVNIIKSVFGKNVSISVRYQKGKKFGVISIYNRTIVAMFKSFCPGKADTKNIPENIMNSNDSIRKACLLGLFDGDGSYVEQYRGIYTTISIQLAYNIKKLLLHFGIPCVVSDSLRNEKWNRVYDVKFTTCNTAVSIFPKLKLSKRVNNNHITYVDDKYIYMRIKKIIVNKYVGKVYDLSVDTKNEHSYCTTVCTVHNSGAGSLVCRLCKITEGLDPIQYNLLFERFLNPERVSMPKQNWAYDVNLYSRVCAA